MATGIVIGILLYAISQMHLHNRKDLVNFDRLLGKSPHLKTVPSAGSVSGLAGAAPLQILTSHCYKFAFIFSEVSFYTAHCMTAMRDGSDNHITFTI